MKTCDRIRDFSREDSSRESSKKTCFKKLFRLNLWSTCLHFEAQYAQKAQKTKKNNRKCYLLQSLLWTCSIYEIVYMNILRETFFFHVVNFHFHSHQNEDKEGIFHGHSFEVLRESSWINNKRKSGDAGGLSIAVGVRGFSSHHYSLMNFLFSCGDSRPFRWM